MKKISGKHTKPEIAMRKALSVRGVRYRLHSKKLPGKPDIVLAKYKIAVFVDGEWWHGRNYERDFHKYPEFWKDKIKQNMIRDARVTDELESMGWLVLRFWHKDIEKKPDDSASRVIEAIEARA